MKKIGLIFSIAIAIMFAFNASAQQVPQYSQYMLNPYLINPAVAGTADHYDIRAGYRRQWVGLTDRDKNGNVYDVSPSTFYLTAHGHIGKDHQRLRGRHKNQNSWHHGLGVQLIVDQTGPTSMNNFKGSYAYDMNIAKGTRISFGASVGFRSFGLDIDKIRLSDGSSGNIGNANLNNSPFNTRFMPDIGVGIWLYHKLFYFGASVDQLLAPSLGTNVTIYTRLNNGSELVNRLTQHYFITGGGIFHPSREIAVIPSLLLKANYYRDGFPVSLDMNVKVRYNNLVWGGLSYRTSDAFVVLVGVLINKSIEIGYSYDYTLSYLNINSSGSHEIMVGYRLEPRAHILSPSDFW